MKRIDTATAWLDKFGAGKNGFRNGDAGIPIASTDLDESWFDHVQEEIANVVEGAGLVVTAGQYDQLLLAIQSIAAGLAAKGVSQGRIVYDTPSTIKMLRGLEANIRFEIDDLVITSAVDLTWDLTADLDVGGEAASTWYYPYLENVAGVLTPHLSATGPEMDPDNGKVGYHPGVGKEGWRAIPLGPGSNSYLAFFNNAASNIEPFDVANSELRPRLDLFPVHALGTTSAVDPTFATVALTNEVPASVREVLIRLEAVGEDLRFLYAPNAATGLLSSVYPSSRAGLARIQASTLQSSVGESGLWVPIENPGAPAIAYANQEVNASASAQANEIFVIGWR